MTIETCTTALVAAGCLAAVVGVYVGNRTAFALLASAIFSTFLCETGVPFNLALWLAIDLCAIMWIVIGWADKVLQGGYGRKRDIAVLMLFAPVWYFYVRRDIEWGSSAVDALVALQMFLTFPARMTWEGMRRWTKASRGGYGPLELVAA